MELDDSYLECNMKIDMYSLWSLKMFLQNILLLNYMQGMRDNPQND
jgi:hypothetical protein